MKVRPNFSDPVYRWHLASFCIVGITALFVALGIYLIYWQIYLPELKDAEMDLRNGCMMEISQDAICHRKIIAINGVPYRDIRIQAQGDLFWRDREFSLKIQQSGQEAEEKVSAIHPKTFEPLLALSPLITAIFVSFAINPKSAKSFLLLALLCVFSIVLVSGTYLNFVKAFGFFTVYPFAVTLFGVLFFILVLYLFETQLASTKMKLWIAVSLIFLIVAITFYSSLFRHNWHYPILLVLLSLGLVLFILLLFTSKFSTRIKIYLLSGFLFMVFPQIIAVYIVSSIETHSRTLRFLISLGIILFSLLPPIVLFYHVKYLKSWRISLERSIIFFFYLLVGIVLFSVINYLVLPALIDGYKVSQTNILQTIFVAALAVLFWEPYVRFAERKILRLPFPPNRWEERFTLKLTQTQNFADLQVALDELMSSFQIISAKIDFQTSHYNQRSLLTRGNPVDFKGGRIEWEEKQHSLQIHAGSTASIHASFGEKQSGMFYSQHEKDALLTAMTQTLIASQFLLKKEEATRLYQRDQERTSELPLLVADNLHDIVLTNLKDILQNMEKHSAPELEAVKSIEKNLRVVMSQLHQDNITEGLHFALANLVTELNQKYAESAPIYFNLLNTGYRYPENIERHTLYIVRELCINAKIHANASYIELFGEFSPQSFQIQLEDDGIGLPENFLETERFGLKGVWHRAEQIDAVVSSLSENGTSFTIQWQAP